MNQVFMMGLSFFLSLSAHAFTVGQSNPNLQGWDGAKVEILVNTANCPAGVDVISLVSEAIEIWNNVPTSNIKVSYGGTTTSSGSMTNPPTVYCETDFDNISGSPDPDYVAGAASVTSPNGQIVSGRIFLNATSGSANLGNFQHEKILTVVAHEIGHLLGLGHSHSKNALMYYDASAKTKASLSQDDIDGMSYLYPSNEFKDNTFAGCGMIAANSIPPRGGGPSLLMLALMMLPVLTYLGLKRPAQPKRPVM